MADLGLLLGAQLRKRLAKRLVEKNRVIAEAAGATRRVENQAAHFIFEDLFARRPDQRRSTNETRGAATSGNLFQLVEQFPYALGVRRLRPCVARRSDTGPPAEHRDFEARIVGNRRQARPSVIMPRLEQGILRKGRGGFNLLGGLVCFEADEFDVPVSEDAS